MVAIDLGSMKEEAHFLKNGHQSKSGIRSGADHQHSWQ
jgi:hypothetical protein